jgi:hypothetical protein
VALSIAQNVPASSSALVASQTVTISAPTAGDLIVVTVIDSLAATPSTTISKVSDNIDTAGTSWAKAEADSPATRKVAGECWYKTAGGSETTVTVAFTANANCIVRVRVLHDSAGGTWSLDQTAIIDGSSTGPSSGATGTTANANEIALSVIGTGSSTLTWGTAPGAPWANDTITHSLATSANISEQSGSDIASSTGTFTYSGTLSATAVWVALVATFKVTASLPGVIVSNGPGRLVPRRRAANW